MATESFRRSRHLILMPIFLRQQDLKQIETHGTEEYPHECCGVLLGRESEEGTLVTDILPLKNSREATSDAPKASPEMFDLLRTAYRLILHAEKKDNVIYDWLERADAILNSSRNRFRILPEDLLRSDREARKRGVDILGFYHSHPDHPARPSQYDREHLLCPWYTTYLILAVENGVPSELTGWSPSEDASNFVPSEVIVTADVEAPALPGASNDKGAP